MKANEEDKKKMLEALETLAYGGEEIKEVTQYQRGANGRDVVKGKNVTRTHKLPDKQALFKLMEIKGVYIEPKVEKAKNALEEEKGEKNLESFVKSLKLN